jgi:hypothetical protein
VLAALPATEGGIQLGAHETSFVLQPTSPGAVESAAAPGRGPIVLRFEQISYRRPVGIYWEVYLNQPAGTPPDPNGPTFAGTLSLFATGDARHGAGVTGAVAELPIAEVLARERQQGLWNGGEVRVSLRPVGAEEASEAARSGPLATVGSVRVLGQ